MQSIQQNKTNTEPRFVRALLIGIMLIFIFIVLIIPLIAIFYEALKEGWALFAASLIDEEALAAIKLTLITAAIILPLNIFFGIAIAWVIARFDFKGKALLTTFIDLPFSVSPVVAGLMYMLLFGSNSVIGGYLENHGIQIIFAVPGIILATAFVTFPFIARELIPLMQSQGSDEEQAALVLGASAWQMFWRVTLPNIKWALIYGIILTNARAMGEFGAVSVVSGHIRGETNTIPLHVEILYNEYNFIGAFACATLLALLALLTLAAQTLATYWQEKKQKESEKREKIFNQSEQTLNWVRLKGNHHEH
ncbi:sulfate ABC transporter permease subunit CysW [Neisseria sp. Ec49-e6-T10]|uniref:sulfate ABC transporter permease subunit CysW n=1 Tax=Neisseria sp. Ec49-e6-T10 TaxID=3140744 RepID=UPI003EB6F662